MKKIAFFSLIVVSLLLYSCGFAQVDADNKLFQLNFDKEYVGQYDENNLKNEAGEIRWSLFDGRASIVENPTSNNNKSLKVEFPKGSVGPQKNGVQFIKELPASNEYYLDYEVFFEAGFDFRKGGKLPGLTSGGSTYTGGVHPDNGEGWSARYMWATRNAGVEALVYFYYIDMSSKYGESVNAGVYFETGKWYRLTQRIKLNEDNLSNGIMQVWIDGKEVINKTGIRYRLWGKGQIDSFYFSTFHGGASAEWAPKNDSSALFDNFKVTKTKPTF